MTNKTTSIDIDEHGNVTQPRDSTNDNGARVYMGSIFGGYLDVDETDTPPGMAPRFLYTPDELRAIADRIEGNE